MTAEPIIVETPASEDEPAHHCEHCDDIDELRSEIAGAQEAVMDLAFAVDFAADDETAAAHDEVEDALEALFEE